MVRPRFLYVVRVSQQRPDGEEKPVGWRLVGANNRELGRSAEVFGSLAECQAAVTRLREKVAGARVLLTMPDAAGSWTWHLEIEGRAVAVAGRRYLRQRECQYNLSQFLVAVPVAQLAVGMTNRPRSRGLPPRGLEGARGTRADQEDEGHASSRTVVRVAGVGAR
ncbi:hypothetical protein ACFYWY_03590 [Streptomyces sp. NPDC002870]|uniref:hypothetical protein n=1 Tax=Streptomyces sp. NPDC002870 TaxID=3364666 RepID=UPI003695BD66